MPFCTFMNAGSRGGDGATVGGLKGIAVGRGGQGCAVEHDEAVAHGKEDVGGRKP